MEGTPPENGAPQNDQGSGTPPDNETPEVVKFDDWYNTLTEPYQEALDEHIAGLRSALTNEREGRKALERQVRELSKKADAGSEVQKQLDSIAGNLAQETQRSTFYETAHSAGVKNLRLAWLAAQDAKLINNDGSVDMAKLKETAPELFASSKPAVPSANGGTGSGNPPAQQRSMNDVLRSAAGIRP